MAAAPGTDVDRLLREARELQAADPEAARGRASEALARAEADGDALGEARARRVRAVASGRTGRVDEALTDFALAAEAARALGDGLLEAQCLHGLSTGRYYQGRYAEAMDLLYRSIAVRRAAGGEGLSEGLSQLGALHGAMGNYGEAVACVTEAVGLLRAEGQTAGEAIAVGNLALLEVECGQLEASLPLFAESVRLSERAGDRVTAANTLANRANALRDLGRHTEAVESARRALQVTRDTGNPHRETTALFSLGAALSAMDPADPDAERTLLDAWALAQSIGSERQFTGILGALGALYRRRGDAARAEEYLGQALASALEHGEARQVVESRRELADLLESEGRHAQALAEFRLFHEAHESLQRQDAQNRLVAQTARLEVERARQEAEVERLRSGELAELNRRNAELLEHLRRRAETLAREATEDPLTGLYNRRYLTDYLPAEVERSRRRGLPLTVAVADLDDFKRINDRFSHQIGDAVLRRAAELILLSCRPGDVVVRYGGEEFVMVFPETPLTSDLRVGAWEVCERVRRAIEGYDWAAVQPGLSVTVSVGVAEAPLSGAEALLDLADTLLYRAKSEGKNRCAAAPADRNPV